MNTNYFERISEEGVLRALSRDDIIIKLKQEFGLDCNPHVKKSLLIQYYLDYKYGGENVRQAPRKTGIENCE